jgi:hypothetical protein
MQRPSQYNNKDANAEAGHYCPQKEIQGRGDFKRYRTSSAPEDGQLKAVVEDLERNASSSNANVQHQTTKPFHVGSNSSRQGGAADGGRDQGHGNKSWSRKQEQNRDKPKKSSKPKEFIMDGQVVPKLDLASNPEHARRMTQRQKAIEFGKNTIGYDEYLKQIPKHKRRNFDPKQPSTPDATVAIPTRRWQGMIKAWRMALHDYDPPELKQAVAVDKTHESEATSSLLDAMANMTSSSSASTSTAAITILSAAKDTKMEQLVDASQRGLQADISSGNDHDYDNNNDIGAADHMQGVTPTSVMGLDAAMATENDASAAGNNMAKKILNYGQPKKNDSTVDDVFFSSHHDSSATGNKHDNELLVDCEEDSDDDLL